MKGISPIVATVILVAVTIAISIAVALWISGLIGGFTGIEKLEITNSYAEQVSGNYFFVINMSNKGTKPVTIDSIFIDRIPYTSQGYQVYVVPSGKLDLSSLNGNGLEISTWAKWTGVFPSSGGGLYFTVAPLNRTWSTTSFPAQINFTARLKYSSFSYTINGQPPASELHLDQFLFSLYLTTLDTTQFSSTEPVLINVYYDVLDNQLIVNATYASFSNSLVSYTAPVSLNLVDNNWHTITVLLTTTEYVDQWALQVFIDGKQVMNIPQLFPSITDQIASVTVQYNPIQGISGLTTAPLIYGTGVGVGFIYPSVPATSPPPPLQDLKTTFYYGTVYLGLNTTTLSLIKFTDTTSLTYYHVWNQTLTQQGLTYTWGNTTSIVHPATLPFTLQPGQSATLVIIPPENKVSPGTMYSITIHTAPGGKYPVVIKP